MAATGLFRERITAAWLLMADLFWEKKYRWPAVDKSLRWNNDWHIPHPWIQAMCGDVQRPTDNERAAVIPRRFVCWCLADTFRSSLPTHLLLLLGIHQHWRIFRYSKDRDADGFFSHTSRHFETVRLSYLDLSSLIPSHRILFILPVEHPLCRWTHWTLLGFCDRPLTWNFVIKSVAHLLSLSSTTNKEGHKRVFEYDRKRFCCVPKEINFRQLVILSALPQPSNFFNDDDDSVLPFDYL
jgi:hypothetical protein